MEAPQIRTSGYITDVKIEGAAITKMLVPWFHNKKDIKINIITRGEWNNFIASRCKLSQPSRVIMGDNESKSLIELTN